jgi:hypothetical protein
MLISLIQMLGFDVFLNGNWRWMVLSIKLFPVDYSLDFLPDPSVSGDGATFGESPIFTQFCKYKKDNAFNILKLNFT